MTSIYGDITDDEFVRLRNRHGDIVLEEPGVAVALVEHLRREEEEALLADMESAIRRQHARSLN